MNRNDIITLPNPLLHQKSHRVSFVDDEVKKLASDMITATLDWEDSRQHESGAALAAVQVAKLLRVVIIRNDFEDKQDRSFSVLINPEVVKTEGEPVEALEGCLSVGNVYGKVSRYPKLKVKAISLEGQPIRITATGFLAQVLQHEIDHTNGILFVDHVKDPAKLFNLQPDGKLIPVKASQ